MPEGPFDILEVQKNSVKFSWKPSKHDGGSPITAYVVEMRESWKSKWSKYGETAPDSTTISVSKLKEGEEYLFRVCAVNSVGQSEFLEMSKPLKPQTPKGECSTSLLSIVGDEIVNLSMLNCPPKKSFLYEDWEYNLPTFSAFSHHSFSKAVRESCPFLSINFKINQIHAEQNFCRNYQPLK